MLPKRSKLRLVFRHRSVGSARHRAAPRRVAESIAVSPSPIGRGPGDIHPRRRRHPQSPAMAIGRDVALGVVIVAGCEACSHRVRIGGHLEVLHCRVALDLTMQAITAKRGVTIGSGKISKYLIKRTVFPNDEKDMLQPWQGFIGL